MKNPRVLVDFDAVLHYYEKWDGPEAKGSPITGIDEALAVLQHLGIKPDIFTTRPAKYVDAWLRKHRLRSKFGLIIDEKPYYLAFFDDRAHNVKPNEAMGLYDAITRWAIANPGTIDYLQKRRILAKPQR